VRLERAVSAAGTMPLMNVLICSLWLNNSFRLMPDA
jgi:hypothetical protein